MLGNINRDGLAALRRESSVVAVTGAPELSLIRPRAKSLAKAAGQTAWGLDFLGIPEMWEKGFRGKGVIVAHLDTGADGKHPALKKAIVKFAQFDNLGNEVKPAPDPFDSDEHGTHTAATIAGRPVKGFAMGVAPEAGLLSAMVIEGGNVIARVLGGMNWAIENEAKVLSMSLGIRGWVEDWVPIIQTLRARGVLPVIAVGNEGAGTSRSPGNYAESLSVGALDQSGAVADFSSSQKFLREKDPVVPDLVAPGVGIKSAVPKGGFAVMDGSSMATPHIAGLAALLFGASPGATVDQIEDAIFKSCKLLPGMTDLRAGRGAPNGPRALAILTNTLTSSVVTSIPSLGRNLAKRATKKPKGHRRAG
jgi:subtilisin family serine protease